MRLSLLAPLIALFGRVTLSCCITFSCCIILAGCITLADSSYESPFDIVAIEALELGQTTLPDALDTLGSPLEVHGHPDGKLLVYRYADRKLFQLEVGPSEALRFVDITQITSEILSNFKFTYERLHYDEDRLVLLFDRDRVLRAVGLDLVTE